MEVQTIDLTAIVRMSLILMHLMALVAAGAGIAFGDYAIFAQRQINASLLTKAGRAVSAALLVLWISGLAVIWLDTQFDWALLATKPKLLAKLTVVSVLTLNGVALHFVAFKRLCTPQGQARSDTALLAVLGAISAVTWLYAMFLGLAKPVARLLGLSGFLGLYIALLTIGMGVALTLIAPRLASRLQSASPLNKQGNADAQGADLEDEHAPLMANP